MKYGWVFNCLLASLILSTCNRPAAEHIGVTRIVSLLPEAEIEGLTTPSPRVRRGRLLPVGDPWHADAPSTKNYLVRDAISAPVPTTIRVRWTIPEGAQLAFAYGLAKESTPGDGARFRVWADEVDGETGGEPQLLFEDELFIEHGAVFWHWREQKLSLEEFSGQRVEIVFETTEAAAGGKTSEAAPGGGGEALWGSPEIYSPRRSGAPPNVILIAVDTLRADRLSCYGYRSTVTPNIDALAADGIRFDQAIAMGNWTTPSFAAAFSGRYVLSHRDGLRSVPGETMVEALQAAGWSTAAVLYKAALYDRGFERGFDYFMNAPRLNVRADENLEYALNWLKRNGERRFFLFLHFNDPHQPFCQPDSRTNNPLRQRLEAYGLSLPVKINRRSAQDIDLSTSAYHSRKFKGCKACKQDGVLLPEFKALASDLYDDAIGYTDTNIGVFLRTLKEQGLYDDALIVLFSDHGEAIWDHHEQYSHGEANLHDELIRVPLIVKPPSGASWARGKTVSTQVRLIDLKPTVLELAGLAVENLHEEARSLVPALLEEEKRPLEEQPAFSSNSKHNVLSLRYRGWKYIRRYASEHDESTALREELYDLGNDRGETTNVAAQESAVLAELRYAMDEHLLAHGPGKIVVAVLDPLAGPYEVSLKWDREASLGPFSLPLRRRESLNGAGTWEYEGVATGRVAVLALFQTAETAVLEVTVRRVDGAETLLVQRVGSEEMSPPRPGLMREILEGERPKVYVFIGEDRPFSDRASESQTANKHQVKALKALGYLR